MTDDQKRALGIGGIGLFALLLLSRRKSSRAGPTQPVSTTGQVAPFVPQNPVIVAPGESIYDPNSQALLSTPAAATGTDTANVSGDTGAGQATTPAAPGYVVNVTYPAHVATKSHAKRPTKRTQTVRRPSPKRVAKSKARAKGSK